MCLGPICWFDQVMGVFVTCNLTNLTAFCHVWHNNFFTHLYLHPVCSEQHVHVWINWFSCITMYDSTCMIIIYNGCFDLIWPIWPKMTKNVPIWPKMTKIVLFLLVLSLTWCSPSPIWSNMHVSVCPTRGLFIRSSEMHVCVLGPIWPCFGMFVIITSAYLTSCVSFAMTDMLAHGAIDLVG